jgi:Ca-activated chloride channel family protein
MSFASPVVLLALGLVPLLLGAYLIAARRRRKYAVRFTVLETLASVASVVPTRRRHLPAALATLAAAALVLAIARPQVSVAVPVERASIMLVTDTSGSMSAEDVDPTRMAAAKSAARAFVDQVPDGQRVGLIGFSDNASVLASPTEDHAIVKDAISTLRADGATATGDALSLALEALQPGKGERAAPSAIVLLSDGKRTAGADPLPIARQAAERNIPIYTISLGTDSGTVQDPSQPWVPPTQVPPDPETMREIARIAKGQAFTVADAGKLDDIYEKLGSRLGTKKEDREVTAGFAGVGLLLLGGAVALGLRRRPQLP